MTFTRMLVGAAVPLFPAARGTFYLKSPELDLYEQQSEPELASANWVLVASGGGGSGSAGNRSVFVYRPGIAPTLENEYDDWALLYADLLATGGQRKVVFDDAGVGVGNPIVLPVGSYDMLGVVLGARVDADHIVVGGTRVECPEGVTFTNLNYLTELVTLVCTATATATLMLPAASASLIYCDLGGRFQSEGTVSFVDASAASACIVFLENSSLDGGSYSAIDTGGGAPFIVVVCEGEDAGVSSNQVRGTNPAAVYSVEVRGVLGVGPDQNTTFAGVVDVARPWYKFCDTWVIDPLGVGAPTNEARFPSWAVFYQYYLTQGTKPKRVEVRNNFTIESGFYTFSDALELTAPEGAGVIITAEDARVDGNISLSGGVTVLVQNADDPFITLNGSSANSFQAEKGAQVLSQGAQPVLDVTSGAVKLRLRSGARFATGLGFVLRTSGLVNCEVFLEDNAGVEADTIEASPGTTVTLFCTTPSVEVDQNQVGATLNTTLLIERCSLDRGKYSYELTATSKVLETTDMGRTLDCNAAGGALAPVLPSAADVQGQIIRFVKIDATGNTVTPTPIGGDTVNGPSVLAVQWEFCTLQAIPGGWRRIG